MKLSEHGVCQKHGVHFSSFRFGSHVSSCSTFSCINSLIYELRIFTEFDDGCFTHQRSVFFKLQLALTYCPVLLSKLFSFLPCTHNQGIDWGRGV